MGIILVPPSLMNRLKSVDLVTTSQKVPKSIDVITNLIRSSKQEPWDDGLISTQEDALLSLKLISTFAEIQ